MSNIPNSAMPHAHAPVEEPEKPSRTAKLKEKAGSVADKAKTSAKTTASKAKATAKANPKTTIAAGAALLAGAVAAAAIPAVRARKKSGGTSTKSASKTKKSS